MKLRLVAGGMMLVAGLLVMINSCKDMGTETPVTVPVNQLSATPPAVTIGSGGVAIVAISGGVRPYTVATPPSPALAAAVLSDTTLTITGVTIASAAGSTSVRVVDGSPSPAKGVTVPITKTYP